jgi:hypothetical protein
MWKVEYFMPYFPIEILIKDTGEKRIINGPEDIPIGINIVVLRTKVSPNES